MSEWSEIKIEALRTLWAQGLSTAEIGRRLYLSKNAVVGKAHRLDLPTRPSPIKRDPSAAPRAPKVRKHTKKYTDKPRQPKKTLAPLPSLSAVMLKPVKAPEVFKYQRPGPCCWIIGGGKYRTLYCDAPITRGSYCAEHAALAYVTKKAAA